MHPTVRTLQLSSAKKSALYSALKTAVLSHFFKSELRRCFYFFVVFFVQFY